MQPEGAHSEVGALYGESLEVQKKPINMEEDIKMDIEEEMHKGQQSAGVGMEPYICRQEFVLEFDNVKFVAEKGKHDKVILQKVNGKVANGRK